MGQQLSSSSTSKKHKRPLRKFFLKKINKNSLSYTFSIIDDDINQDNKNNIINNLINVNSASENELLKIREIDYDLSKNIIKHRKTIGSYQKLEDLVVVPGMGAKKFNLIKNQLICNSNNTNLRYSIQSFDSLKSYESTKSTFNSNKLKLININKTNIFELQSTFGITQEIAAAIIDYRNKKGPFKKIDELKKIKRMDYIILDNIRRYLTLNDEEDVDEQQQHQEINGDTTEITSNSNGYLRNGYIKNSTNGLINGMPKSTLLDIFELLSAYSSRPLINELFKNIRNDKPAFRISSWNLEDLTIEKITNLGVKEVICRTILENGWSILIIENVKNEIALKVICDELNKPKLKRTDEWKLNNFNWNYNYDVNLKIGYIYDGAGRNENSIKLTSTTTTKNEEEIDELIITNFLINNTINIKIINLLPVPSMYTSLNLDKNELLDNNCLIFFNNNNINNENLINFKKINFGNNYFNNYKLSRKFLINRNFENLLTGWNGFVKNGLNHLAIPSGWSWGGYVSSYLPIWIEFYIDNELNL